MKSFLQKIVLIVVMIVGSVGFGVRVFAQITGSVSGTIQLPTGGVFFYVPFGTNAPHVNLSLAPVSSSPSTSSPGAYDETLSVTPSANLNNPASLTMKVYVPYPPRLAYQQAVTVPTGSNPSSIVVSSLSPGYYEAALYSNNVQVTNPIYFAPGSPTGSSGGLSVVFPPGQQAITSTSATLKGLVSVAVTSPVKIAYVWAPSGSPFANETPLLSMISPGLIQGTTQTVTLSMTNLTPDTAYQFAIENKIANTISPTLEFRTTNNSSTVTSLGSSYNAPPVASAVVDTISGTGIVPRCGRTPNGTTIKEGSPDTRMCDANDFIILTGNILKYILIILGPIVAIMAMYAGAMIIWLGKIPDKTSEQAAALRNYKAMLVRVAIGLVIILCAWVLISTIINELGVKTNYQMLSMLDTIKRS